MLDTDQPDELLARALTEARERAAQARPAIDRSGTRDRILDTAIEMFARRGFEACSVRDLAVAVGIKAPGLYSHFSSKEAILAEAMLRTLGEFLEYVTAESTATSPLERLEEMVKRHVRIQTERRDLARANDMLMNSESIGDFLPAAEYDLLVRSQRAYYELVRSGISAALGPDSTVDIAIAAFAVIGMCDEVTVWYRPGGRLDPEQVADTYWQFVKQMLGL
ncbi:TetR/AcrR family transcriptional regulator [Gordonia sp. TBRC 11910]|uniref:TetR/AcrR family transcriptional regulator n=1 Tax=Gordonia asplenii TaxID=2725283 RepID=A0A848KUN1_9ACTN|nr:TetR/AcrR family transcriptional regulator [Gordonia asplenii]NMO02240.1 TetR/AcrR family transcriptional regulator [Gordonia asplenii]